MWTHNQPATEPPTLTMMDMSTALMLSEGLHPTSQEHCVKSIDRQMAPSGLTLGW